MKKKSNLTSNNGSASIASSGLQVNHDKVKPKPLNFEGITGEIRVNNLVGVGLHNASVQQPDSSRGIKVTSARLPVQDASSTAVTLEPKV